MQSLSRSVKNYIANYGRINVFKRDASKFYKPLVKTINDMQRYVIMHFAVKKDHIGVFKFLCGMDKDKHYIKGLSIIEEAVKCGNLQIVEYLVDSGYDLRRGDYYVLQLAAEYGNLQMIKYLLNHGCDPHANDNYAFEITAKNGDFETLKYIHKFMHSRISGAIEYTIKGKHFEIVKFLIEAGYKPYTMNIVACAAEIGSLEITEYLVKSGFDPHAEDDCAIKLASQSGHLDVVKYLVGLGCDPRADDNHAVRWATYYNHLDVVKYLVECGCDPNVDSWAIDNSFYKDQLDMVEYLKSIGGKQSAEIDHHLLLQKAIEKNDIEGIKLHTSMKYETNYQNNITINIAIETNNVYAIDYLINYGYDISTVFYPMVLAAKFGHLEMIKYLAQKPQDRELEFAAHSAADKGHLHIIKYLVSQGYDPSCDSDILNDAAKNGHLEIVKYLINCGSPIDSYSIFSAIEKNHYDVALYLCCRVE